MHTIVCQVLEQVKQVILGVLIFSFHPLVITPSSNTVRFHPIPLGGGYSHNGLKSYESILTAIDHSLFTSLEYGFQSTLE
jgi:hypothetical protein